MKTSRSHHLARSGLRRARGLTLVEVLIVLAIVAVMMGAIVIGSGQLASSRARHSSTMIAGAIRIGFSRASATSKSVRLVMDFTESEIWLEEGDQPMLVQSKDLTGTGGAAAGTVAEKTAIEESGRIIKGPTAPRTAFHEIDPMGLAASAPGKGHKALERGIKFREVQTSHDDDPRKDGRAYLYFWPGGQTERASIQLKVGEANEEKDAITLVVSPLTGKITVKDGAVALAKPTDDKESSEREDPGAF
ncbi:MAG: ral secretion pathway protein [Labilithrix sp.]|nr:ral secretion pathway protein [Labilithrix sp.]